VDVLEGRTTLEGGVRATPIPNLSILTAGSATPHPAELLTGRAMKELVELARGAYDSIWIDSPPLIPVADARDITRIADLILLVVRSAATRSRAISRAIDLLHLREGQTAAAVLNDIKGSVDRQYGYSRYGYYGQSPAESQSGGREGRERQQPRGAGRT
jgi:capsular exopolysaccharide synthesis family protein